jgi:hypothetical protein
MSIGFTAAPSALGYLYQARLALLMLLDREPGTVVSIESIDDVAFEQGGDHLERIQLKHHVSSQGSLTDASSDLWKTLRIWCTAINDGAVQLGRDVFSIVTTGSAPEDSVAWKLHHESYGHRDIDGALTRLRTVAAESQNADNQPAYQIFMQLEPTQQEALLQSVSVLDNSPNILDVRHQVRHKIRYSTSPEYLDAVYERLEGWWAQRIIECLMGTSSNISQAELWAKINDIQEQFRTDNLPIDYYDLHIPDEAQLDERDKVFIKQLRLVMLSQPRIKKAIADYYKAFHQRSRWVRDELLFCDEWEKYEDRLKDEWERRFQIMCEEMPVSPKEDDLQQRGRSLFNWVDTDASIHIRSQCTEPYIMRGSYHILANDLKVGWHPEFLNRLRHLLAKDLEDVA